MDPKRAIVRHYLSALAYRTQKALRDAPEDFADFRVADNVRTPHELIWHMIEVVGYARTQFVGGAWRPERLPFGEDIQRFHDVLAELNHHLATDTQLASISLEQLLQGPLADAMTHAGQLALLRRLAGSPVPSEDFIFADVRLGSVGSDQPLPAAPDPEWSG